MKRKTKLISFLLCGVMIFGMIGCKGQEETKEPEEDNPKVVEDSGEDYDLHKLVSENKSLVATTEIVGRMEIPAGTEFVQGGYTDGKYYYQAFIRRDNASGEVENEDVVVKYDMQTKQVVKESEKLKLNHCNDFTYNAKTGKLYICNATGRKNIVSIMNPETLEIEGEIDLGFEIFSINYNEKRDMYVVGIAGGQTFRFLDAEFRIASDIFDPTTRTINYTTQGNTSDDDYIYFVLYKENVITVYDWDGNFVSWIKTDIPKTAEPENISVVGNDIYMGVSVDEHSAQNIFKIKTLKPEE